MTLVSESPRLLLTATLELSNPRTLEQNELAQRINGNSYYPAIGLSLLRFVRKFDCSKVLKPHSPIH